MQIKIERSIRKEVGSCRETYFTAEINGETTKGYYIFRKLLGITNETQNGLLESGRITIYIGNDNKVFEWEENLDTIEAGLLQKTLQKRVDEVLQWKASLSYARTDTFTIEV